MIKIAIIKYNGMLQNKHWWQRIKFSKDGKKVSLILNDLKPGYIYELKLGGIKSVTGQLLANKLICYTLNKLRT